MRSWLGLLVVFLGSTGCGQPITERATARPRETGATTQVGSAPHAGSVSEPSPVTAGAPTSEWFLEMPPPGPPPYAWGPYWVCSLAAQEPACSQMTQNTSQDTWSIEPWTPALPPVKTRLRGLVGLFKGDPDVLDGDGTWWSNSRDGWKSAAETRGTTQIAGLGGMVCGATARGVWCDDAGRMKRFDVGHPVELSVYGYTAAFALANGRVGLIDGSSYKPLALVWSSALAQTKSLTILQGRLACGLTAAGQIVCVTFAAPDKALGVGSEEVGGQHFYDGHDGVAADGVSFTALHSSAAALVALAKDGRVFALRPPDEQGWMFAVDGVDLVGQDQVCVVRRSGPWLCTH